MWKQLIRCSIVGGIIVFLWVMLSWMVLPMHKMTMNKFTDSAATVSAITENAPKDGIYVYPGMDAKVEGKQPMLFVNVARGIDFKSMAKPMVIGLLTQMMSAFFVTYLLLRAKAMKYWPRVRFITVAGIFAAFVGTVPAWNWWHFPGAWTLAEMCDIIIGWFLGGLVIAKLVKK